MDRTISLFFSKWKKVINKILQVKLVHLEKKKVFPAQPFSFYSIIWALPSWTMPTSSGNNASMYCTVFLANTGTCTSSRIPQRHSRLCGVPQTEDTSVIGFNSNQTFKQFQASGRICHDSQKELIWLSREQTERERTKTKKKIILRHVYWFLLNLASERGGKMQGMHFLKL